MDCFKVLCVLFSITISTSAEIAPFFRIDYTYLTEDNIFIKIHHETRRWADAVSACANEDAELFYPINRNEAMILRYLPSFENTFWLPIHDMIVKGYFETIFGEAVADVYVDWAKNEPNVSVGHCVNFDGQYKTKDCEKKASFVCKKKINSDFIYNENCNTFDPSYIDYTGDEKKCYKVHTTPRNWHDAANTCKMEYSGLFVLQSEHEAFELDHKISRGNIKSDDFVDSSILHSGFHDLFSIGQYVTIKGIPLHKTGYEIWSPYYPKSYPGARCGSVVIGGTLQNVDCNINAGFICERPYLRSDDMTTVKHSTIPAELLEPTTDASVNVTLSDLSYTTSPPV